MKIRLIILVCLLQVTIVNLAQEAERPAVKPVRLFIGIQPGIKPGPLMVDVNQYPLDINILPITIVYALNRHWALRMHTIWDLELRPATYPTVSAAVGMEFAAPFYLSLKNSEEGHRGFYISPVITPGYNNLNAYYLLRTCGEAGFSFLFGYKWSVSLAVQTGVEFQKYPNDPFIRRVPYTIPVIALGLWL